jgi:hypothetical protein
MNAQNREMTRVAKRVSIMLFLQRLGKKPAKETPRYALYSAPYRTDVHPSMVVYKQTNRWTDLSKGISGDVIDLAKLIYGVGFTDAVRYIVDDISAGSVVDEIKAASCKAADEAVKRMTVSRLENARLCSYLSTRQIDLSVANRYCVEVYYWHKARQYFALGFENISHAYETRNAFFKRCVGPKDISIIKKHPGNKNCLVFEGFMDFLSYATLSQKNPTQFPFGEDIDAIVLNSVAMVRQALEYICCYDNVKCYLDNDEAGEKAFQIIISAKPDAIDASSEYADYKDLNDYIRGRRLPK